MGHYDCAKCHQFVCSCDDKVDGRLNASSPQTRPLMFFTEDELDVVQWNWESLKADLAMFSATDPSIEFHQRSVDLFERILRRHKRLP